MPQIFQILRCFQCLVFQVHQTKKSNKWECKLCGAKQSVKRHYGIGTAKDCRLHVQKLNGIRSEVDDLKESIKQDSDDDDIEICEPVTKKCHLKPENSKWMEYVETEKIVDVDVSPGDSKSLDGAQVVLEINKKRRKSSFKCPKKVETRSPALKECDYNKLPNDTIRTTYPVTCNIRVQSQMEEKCFSNISKEQPANNELLNKSQASQIHKNKITKQFVPSAVNSSSKWAQFVDEDDYVNNDEYDTTPFLISDNTTQSSKSSLFNLCGDDDLDTVLDI